MHDSFMTMSSLKNIFIEAAVSLANESLQEGGGPFGAVILKDGKIIARGKNRVVAKHDPTAHAEVAAIRQACKLLKTHDLSGCEIYASCEPCPMCLGAIYWARLDGIYFASTRNDAAKAGFDDSFFYNELALPLSQRKIPVEQISCKSEAAVWIAWASKTNKIQY